MNTLLVLLIAHTLGDYLLQSGKMAAEKGKRAAALLGHALLYGLAMAAVFLCAPWRAALPAWGLLTLSHWGIDWLRLRADRRWSRPQAGLISFVVDQLLHLGMLLLSLLLFLRGRQTGLMASLSAASWFRPALVYGAVLCLLWDPTAVLVRKVFELFPPSGEAEESSPARSGELIGKLERLIVAALVLCGSAGTIGFVLTAKSVARFKQLEDRDFAERYLVGTLLSVGVALCVSLLLKKLL